MAGISTALEGLAEVKALLDAPFGDSLIEGTEAIQSLSKQSKIIADFFDRLKMEGLNAVSKDEDMVAIIAQYDALISGIVNKQIGPPTREIMTKVMGQSEGLQDAIKATFVEYVVAVGDKLSQYRPKDSKFPQTPKSEPANPAPSVMGLHMGPGGRAGAFLPHDHSTGSAAHQATRVEMGDDKKKKKLSNKEAKEEVAPPPKKKTE